MIEISNQLPKEFTDYFAARYDFCLMLALIFERPYEKEMEDEQYQIKNFIRKKVRIMISKKKNEVDKLKKILEDNFPLKS